MAHKNQHCAHWVAKRKITKKPSAKQKSYRARLAAASQACAGAPRKLFRLCVSSSMIRGARVGRRGK